MGEGVVKHTRVKWRAQQVRWVSAECPSECEWHCREYSTRCLQPLPQTHLLPCGATIKARRHWQMDYKQRLTTGWDIVGSFFSVWRRNAFTWANTCCEVCQNNPELPAGRDAVSNLTELSPFEDIKLVSRFLLTDYTCIKLLLISR